LVCDIDKTLTEAGAALDEKTAEIVVEILRLGVPFIVISGVDYEGDEGVKRRFIDVMEDYVNRKFQSREERGRILKKLAIGTNDGTQIYMYDRASGAFRCIFASDMIKEVGKDKYERALKIVDESIPEDEHRRIVSKTLSRTFDDASWRQFRKDCLHISRTDGVVTEFKFFFAGAGAKRQEKERFNKEAVLEVDGGKEVIRGGWDIRDRYRKVIEARFAEEDIKIDCTLGGSSAMDFTMLGVDKGYGIDLIFSKVVPVFYKAMPGEARVFVGDALRPEGNDEPAIKFADTVINVGKATDLSKSRFYRPEIAGFELPMQGPTGFRKFAARYIYVMRKKIGDRASYTLTEAPAVKPPEGHGAKGGIEDYRSTLMEAVLGNFDAAKMATLMFKGGLAGTNEEAYLERRLIDSGYDIVYKGETYNPSPEEVLRRWEKGIRKSIERLKSFKFAGIEKS
jgi:hydroxymethylpyrimidine pyrophosphatase-like HAD family hydrolase